MIFYPPPLPIIQTFSKVITCGICNWKIYMAQRIVERTLDNIRIITPTINNKYSRWYRYPYDINRIRFACMFWRTSHPGFEYMSPMCYLSLNSKVIYIIANFNNTLLEGHYFIIWPDLTSPFLKKLKLHSNIKYKKNNKC